jgi:bacteriorhodopsin
METTVLSIGAAAMAFGALAFLTLARGAPEGQRPLYIATFFVAFVAFSAYLAMAFGQGVTTIVDAEGNERVVYWARYVDWFITTPLLLLDLALLAGLRRDLMAAIMGLDVFMIVTGLIAALSEESIQRWAWYALSCIAMIGIFVILFGQMASVGKSLGGKAAGLYRTLTVLLIILWTIYPILWLLGTEGLSLLPLEGEIVVFAIIDVTAKVGFGFILLTSKGALKESGKAAPATA